MRGEPYLRGLTIHDIWIHPFGMVGHAVERIHEHLAQRSYEARGPADGSATTSPTSRSGGGAAAARDRNAVLARPDRPGWRCAAVPGAPESSSSCSRRASRVREDTPSFRYTRARW